MHPYLKQTGFNKPLWMQEITEPVTIGDFTFKPPSCNPDAISDRHAASLCCDSLEWMSYNFSNDEEVLELWSHYVLARGRVVCTGLGFGLRESWIIDKPGVSEVIVVERNPNVIEFHKRYNSELLSRLTVLNMDARDLSIECDTLLLDHYVYPFSDIMPNARVICERVKCQNAWWWPLEDLILQNAKFGSFYEFFARHRAEENPWIADVSHAELYDFISTWTTTYTTRERRAAQNSGRSWR